jgi:hypothetical protein
MHDRCFREKHPAYSRYGGRGITVCARWREFENFLADMGERPEGMTLDRFPNKDGDYEPGNCRWATAAQQGSNKDQAKNISIRGVEKPISVWAREFGIHAATFKKRLARGDYLR